VVILTVSDGHRLHSTNGHFVEGLAIPVNPLIGEERAIVAARPNVNPPVPAEASGKTELVVYKPGPWGSKSPSHLVYLVTFPQSSCAPLIIVAAFSGRTMGQESTCVW
jgi:hypothetical protein